MHYLALKDRYLNEDIRFLSNRTIIEYDMERAGLSIIQKYHLLPKKQIKDLLELSKKTNSVNLKYGKKQADIQIGVMQRDNAKLRDGLKEGFKESRDLFLTQNNLSEQDVLSIKKDAIFVMKQVNEQRFDEFVNFREKNRYTSYLLLDKIEIYYKDGVLDIKGLGEVDEKIHHDYFISFLIRFFKKAESSSEEDVLKFLRIFIDHYKRRELEDEFYIPFKTHGMYNYNDGTESQVNYRNNKSELDISYNYKILVNLVQYVL